MILDIRYLISDCRLEISDIRIKISDWRFRISDIRLEILELSRFIGNHRYSRKAKSILFIGASQLRIH